MTILIKIHKLNGESFYLNAAKIYTVHETPTGSMIYYEPYNSENMVDWTSATETPEQIAALASGQSLPWSPEP